MDAWRALEDYCVRTFNPDSDRRISIQPFAYLKEFSDLAAGGVGSGQIQIQANGSFVLNSIRVAAYIAASGYEADPALKLQIQDTGSQEYLWSESMPIVTVAEQLQTSGLPSLPYPRIFAGRSAVQLDIQNYSDILSSSYTVKKASIALIGALVRDFGKIAP